MQAPRMKIQATATATQEEASYQRIQEEAGQEVRRTCRRAAAVEKEAVARECAMLALGSGRRLVSGVLAHWGGEVRQAEAAASLPRSAAGGSLVRRARR